MQAMKNENKKAIHILTVCTGNICRSPMAEGILKTMIGETAMISISSAGTHALQGNPASEFALIAAYEQGIDISEHQSRALNEELIRANTMILCMEPIHIEWILSVDSSAGETVYSLPAFSENSKLKKIPDPYGSSLGAYRECFSTIHDCLARFIDTKVRDGFFPGSVMKNS
jgi:protein-tyrosine-phosphatase